MAAGKARAVLWQVLCSEGRSEYYGFMNMIRGPVNPYDRRLLDAFNELADANESGDRARIARAEVQCQWIKAKHRKAATGKEPWER